MMALLLSALVLVTLCVAGLGIKVILRHNGEFSHRCVASCSAAGRHEDCPSYQLHHGNTATQLAQAVKMADEKE